METTESAQVQAQEAQQNTQKRSLPFTRLSTKLSQLIPALILVAITIFIAYKNYTPDTYLTGWDTLHPEFNYKTYLNRIIQGVWQEHQGLGATAAQAHASEITRMPVLMLLDLFFAKSFVRYSYAFLMLILGPLGVYFLLLKLFSLKPPREQETQNTGISSVVSSPSTPPVPAILASFLGACFYLLNLGIMQHFYVPLEMFLTHFGYLGFIFLTTIKYLENSSKKNLFIFILVTLLSTSQAHTPTLFYALLATYVGFLAILGIIDLLSERRYANSLIKKNLLKKGIILTVTTLILNSFWLLPQVYFAIKHGDDIQKSKIHKLFSEEAFLHNKQYGTLKDVALMKNFLFNWGEHVGDGKFGTLLNEYDYHLAQPGVLVIGYGFFAIVLLGILFALFKKSNQQKAYLTAFLGIFLISLFFIFNVNPPLGGLFKFFQKYVPLFQEAFRFPFTKFSILAILSYAVFFSYFWFRIFNFTSKKLATASKNFLNGLVLLSVMGALVYYTLPFFKGYLISPSMRVKIPDRYFEMFEYFNEQAEFGRVAHLPIHTMWGWLYYDWDAHNMGYQGAGFLWFGIRQPLLDREFDRWGLDNESFYREMSYAVYSEDPSFLGESVVHLENVLNKYDVKWLVVDSSVFIPGADNKQLFLPEIKDLLESSENIVLERSFGEDLAVYKYLPDTPFVETKVKNASELREVNFSGAPVIRGPWDEIDFLTYYTSNFEITSYANIELYPKGNPVVKPFSEKELIKNISSDDESIYFSDLGKFEFVFGNDYSDQHFSFPLDQQSILVGDSSNRYDLLENIQIDTFSSASLESCALPQRGSSYSINEMPNGFEIEARRSNACVTLPLNQLLEGNTELIQNADLLEFFVNMGNAEKSDVCMFDTTTGLCLNDYSKGSSKGFVDISKIDNFDNMYLRFITYGSQSDTKVVTSFSDVEFTFYDLVQSGGAIGDGGYPATVSSFFYERLSVQTSEDGQLKLPKQITSDDFIPAVKNDVRYCSNSDRNLEKSSYIKGEYYIEYNSEVESVCDSFQMPYLAQDIDYILEVESRNVTGLPIRLCLTNEYSKRCDVYDSLSASKEFTKDYFLVPAISDKKGYTLSLSNIKLGNNPSINQVKGFSLTPVPYSYLNALREKVEKPIEFEGKKLITFSQAYEDGWMLFGKGVKDAQHIKVNNWQNGWLVNDSVELQDVQIVFWPQILEYLGFVSVVSLMIIALIKRQK